MLNIKAKQVKHEGQVCRGMWEVKKGGLHFIIETRDDGFKGWKITEETEQQLIGFEDTKREGLWLVQEVLNARCL